jgi:hypothetical protein
MDRDEHDMSGDDDDGLRAAVAAFIEGPPPPPPHESIFAPGEAERLGMYIEAREMDVMLAQVGNAAAERADQIAELEKLREADATEFFRSGASDRLMALVADGED